MNGIDPIKQVFAESTLGNHFLEITVGGTNQTDILRVSAFETTITARHSAEETAFIRSLTGMANNLNQLTRLSHQAGFHRTQRTVIEFLQKLKEIIVRYRHGERRPS